MFRLRTGNTRMITATIAQLDESDYDELMRFRRQVTKEGKFIRFPNDSRKKMEENQKFFSSNHHRHLALKEDEKIIGLCYFSLEHVSKIATLQTLVVLKSNAGKGLGFALLKAMEEECKELKMETITADVDQTNEVALQFYKRNGYKSFRHRFETVILRKKL